MSGRASYRIAPREIFNKYFHTKCNAQTRNYQFKVHRINFPFLGPQIIQDKWMNSSNVAGARARAAEEKYEMFIYAWIFIDRVQRGFPLLRRRRRRRGSSCS